MSINPADLTHPATEAQYTGKDFSSDYGLAITALAAAHATGPDGLTAGRFFLTEESRIKIGMAALESTWRLGGYAALVRLIAPLWPNPISADLAEWAARREVGRPPR